MSGALSTGQQNALAQIDGRLNNVLYAGNGVSIVTARKLVELGVCEWAVEPYTRHRTRPGGRIIPVTEWGIRRKKS
jgi:hypothetical protein